MCSLQLNGQKTAKDYYSVLEMKKILLYTPETNRWKKSLSKAFIKSGYEAEWIKEYTPSKHSDIVFSMWADEQLETITRLFPGKIYTYIRHYEIYADMIPKINWERVSGIFFCAKHIQKMANQIHGKLIGTIPQYFVPNWLDTSEFNLRNGVNNKKIALSCLINRKKNLPLVLQILMVLPEEYTLHIV